MTARRRILFVDDDARVLDTLERMTRGYADEWETRFAASGSEALGVLEEGNFDALVTDIAMPEMSGADLLRAVAEKHPKLIRIVLAPMADQPEVMACAALTNQFITRPCEDDELYAAVERAFNMESAVRLEKVSRIVERMDRLPTLPDLYLRLVERMQDPECSIEDIGKIVAQDIGMTARILKLVNSAYFGLRRRVSTPQEAVNYMGMDTVKALVLSINAFAQYEGAQLGGITLESLWNHSLVTAGYAKTIAREAGAGNRAVDEAFVAGMLHDAGKLALAANFAEEYEQVIELKKEEEIDTLAAEEKVFGMAHPDVGGHLLGFWGLPTAVVDAVSWHHDPMACLEHRFDALACVHAANAWAHAGEEEDPPKIDEAFYAEIGMDDSLDYWRDACLEPDTEDSAAV